MRKIAQGYHNYRSLYKAIKRNSCEIGAIVRSKQLLNTQNITCRGGKLKALAAKASRSCVLCPTLSMKPAPEFIPEHL